MPQYSSINCFETKQNRKSSSEYIKKKKAFTIYANTNTNYNLTTNSNTIQTTTTCLKHVGGFNINSYDRLIDIIKGKYYSFYDCNKSERDKITPDSTQNLIEGGYQTNNNSILELNTAYFNSFPRDELQNFKLVLETKELLDVLLYVIIVRAIQNSNRIDILIPTGITLAAYSIEFNPPVPNNHNDISDIDTAGLDISHNNIDKIHASDLSGIKYHTPTDNDYLNFAPLLTTSSTFNNYPIILDTSFNVFASYDAERLSYNIVNIEGIEIRTIKYSNRIDVLIPEYCTIGAYSIQFNQNLTNATLKDIADLDISQNNNNQILTADVYGQNYHSTTFKDSNYENFAPLLYFNPSYNGNPIAPSQWNIFSTIDADDLRFQNHYIDQIDLSFSNTQITAKCDTSYCTIGTYLIEFSTPINPNDISSSAGLTIYSSPHPTNKILVTDINGINYHKLTNTPVPLLTSNPPQNLTVIPARCIFSTIDGDILEQKWENIP